MLVIPASFIPCFDLLSNLSFLISFLFLFKSNQLLLILISIVFIIKNNTNYRFNLLLKLKGEELSKSDNECVYLYAWCTLLRYFLIGIAINEVYKFLK